MLRIAEADACELLPCQGARSAGDVELDQNLASRCDVQDIALASVLDARPPGLVMLVDHRDPVTLTDAVVGAGDLGFGATEFAALERDDVERGR